jgi:GntR family transcriptional regulator, rspAB operon transcriptional repressor
VRPRDAVYSTLKRRILLNDLPPETALTELGVAQELGCSQGTVREALLRLQEDGLVLRGGHRGTTVTPLDADEATEMLALRRRLETRAAERAARRARPADLAHLACLLDDMLDAAKAGDDYGLIEIDTAFHMAIFRLAGLRALDQILQRCILHSHRQKLWEPRHQRPLVETARRHRPIIDALERGGDALAAALAHHIDTIVDIPPERLAV